MNSICSAPIPWPTLLEYWLDAPDVQPTAEIEEHLMGCAECTEALAEIAALFAGARAAFRKGLVGAFITPELLDSLSDAGLRISRYYVPPDGRVHCSVGPEDELVVGILEVRLEGVKRLDAIVERSTDGRASRTVDIPFLEKAREVVIVPKTALLRVGPPLEARVTLVAVEDGCDRAIGAYTFNHEPHSL